MSASSDSRGHASGSPAPPPAPPARPRAGTAGSPRLLYLHGFASSPESSKAVRFAEHARARFGLEIERLDLRVPSFEHLRFSEMQRVVREAIGGPEERVVVMGSSLGGLTAAHVAAAEPRVSGLVLLAPAFRLAERWEARLGEVALRAWKESGWLEVDDHATGKKARLDFAFIEELGRLGRAQPAPDVRVPTLIIHGANDDVVVPELSRAWAEGKRHVRRVVVEDGHELRDTMTAWLPEVDAFLAPFFGPPL